MKLPRNLSGQQLVKILEKHGYEPVRQKGSHMMLVHPGPPRHKIAIPLHKKIKVGTLSSIINVVIKYLKISKDEFFD